MNSRAIQFNRQTKETRINIELIIDGNRDVNVHTGFGFFDHMLTALAFHAGWNLHLHAEGDSHVDDHHTLEDCGMALGSALLNLVSDKSGIARFGSRYAPLDESLARCVVDFSGRGNSVVQLGLKREMIGTVATENLTHFFQSFANAGKFTLHVDVLRGENDHHKAEAAFKATALALGDALTMKADGGVLSTKGMLAT